MFFLSNNYSIRKQKKYRKMPKVRAHFTKNGLKSNN